MNSYGWYDVQSGRRLKVVIWDGTVTFQMEAPDGSRIEMDIELDCDNLKKMAKAILEALEETKTSKAEMEQYKKNIRESSNEIDLVAALAINPSYFYKVVQYICEDDFADIRAKTILRAVARAHLMKDPTLANILELIKNPEARQIITKIAVSGEFDDVDPRLFCDGIKYVRRQSLIRKKENVLALLACRKFKFNSAGETELLKRIQSLDNEIWDVEKKNFVI